MRVSINVTDYSWPTAIGEELDRIVRAADDGGLDTVWVADHLVQTDPTSDPGAAMLESATTLGFLAARSERVRLGTMVAAVTYRPPAVLIKAVTTLDVLSGGRAWLGVGSGYSESEARAMGLPLPPLGERFDRLDETLRLAKRMFSGDRSPFEGTHYRLDRPIAQPAPLSRPHPPVLIGGMGERKTLRLVARHGDACNLFDVPDDGTVLRHKLSVLAEHCAAENRDPADIDKTVSTRLADDMSAAEFADRCDRLRALGMEHVVTITTGPWTRAKLDTVTKAARRLR